MKYEWLEQLTYHLHGSSSENNKCGVKIVDFSEVPSVTERSVPKKVSAVQPVHRAPDISGAFLMASYS